MLGSIPKRQQNATRKGAELKYKAKSVSYAVINGVYYKLSTRESISLKTNFVGVVILSIGSAGI